MKAIVLAGGLGTRLANVIGDVPKPMAPIGPRPFLEYLLDYLAEQGVVAVLLAVSYRWEAIHQHFDDEYRGMELRYSVEDEPLGTGGAIRRALDLIPDEEVVVLNGDTLFRVDLEDLAVAHRRNGGGLTIALKRMDERGRFGGVDVSAGGEIVGFQEKHSGGKGWINGGVYLLNRSLFDNIELPESFSFERDFVEQNISRIRPHAFLSTAPFVDMGVPEDYARAQREIGFRG